MIKLEHVSKSYSAGIPALNDVNLEIEDGEFVFIVGDLNYRIDMDAQTVYLEYSFIIL